MYDVIGDKCMYLTYYVHFVLAQKPPPPPPHPVGKGLLIHVISRSNTTTHHSR